MEFKVKNDTHLVYKWEDLGEAFKSFGEASEMLKSAWNIIESEYTQVRRRQGKDVAPGYYVVNHDEPYADEILEVIKKGELAKKKGQ